MCLSIVNETSPQVTLCTVSLVLKQFSRHKQARRSSVLNLWKFFLGDRTMIPSDSVGILAPHTNRLGLRHESVQVETRLSTVSETKCTHRYISALSWVKALRLCSMVSHITTTIEFGYTACGTDGWNAYIRIRISRPSAVTYLRILRALHNNETVV